MPVGGIENSHSRQGPSIARLPVSARNAVTGNGTICGHIGTYPAVEKILDWRRDEPDDNVETRGNALAEAGRCILPGWRHWTRRRQRLN
jgi:hypothetical protein